MHIEQLTRLIASQDGVITLTQAVASGMSPAAVGRKVQTSEWRRLAAGVYLVRTHHLSHQARLRAAVFACGKNAAASGLSAAWWHGMIELAPARPSVTIPVHRQVRRVQQYNVRRRILNQHDVTTLRELPITDVALTVLESATASQSGSVLMDQALQTRVSLQLLEEAHERNGDRAGARRAKKLLLIAATGGRSEAEKLLHQILRKYGFAGWQAQFSTAGFSVDVAFVDARVLIEVDGWAFHSDAQQRSNDLRRQNALVNAGWQVLRFDWHRLTHDPDGVVADVRQALKGSALCSFAR